MKSNCSPKIPLIVCCVVAGIFAFSAIVMWLWNAILPEVIEVSPISYWQAMGILVLSKILFGGFRGGPRGGKRHSWKKEMLYKCRHMSPEEKARFKEAMRQRVSGHSQVDSETQS